MRLFASLGELFNAARDHLGTCERASLRSTEEDCETPTYRRLSKDEADPNEDGDPGGKSTERCQQTRHAVPRDRPDQAAVSRGNDLNDGEERRECGDGEYGPQYRLRTLLCAAFKPETKCDQRWWKEPAPRTEPGGEDVAQRVSEKSAPWQDQADRKYNPGHRKEEEDQRSPCGTAHNT